MGYGGYYRVRLGETIGIMVAQAMLMHLLINQPLRDWSLTNSANANKKTLAF